MSSIALSHPSAAVGVRAYVSNVAEAVRSLAVALFSYSPVRQSVARPKAVQRRKAKSVYALYQMAGQYETLSPSLAAELRHIAARQN